MSTAGCLFLRHGGVATPIVPCKLSFLVLKPLSHRSNAICLKKSLRHRGRKLPVVVVHVRLGLLSSKTELLNEFIVLSGFISLWSAVFFPNNRPTPSCTIWPTFFKKDQKPDPTDDDPCYLFLFFLLLFFLMACFFVPESTVINIVYRSFRCFSTRKKNPHQYCLYNYWGACSWSRWLIIKSSSSSSRFCRMTLSDGSISLTAISRSNGVVLGASVV